MKLTGEYMRNDDGRGSKREKSHREKKNWRGHAEYKERKKVRNAKRPAQRFLGVDEETGLGLGWTRE
jgi:nitroreductase